MRYAIFSDIHGNRPAWNAVLKDMRALEVDVFVCLGDIVGYGPKPQEVLDGIRAVTTNIVIGNHDAAAVGLLDASIFNDKARRVIEWTRKKLNRDSIKFLSEAPLVIGDEELMFVHAEMEEPGRFGYIDSEEEARSNFKSVPGKLTFIGHTHHPCVFVEGADGVVKRLPDDDVVLDEGSRYIINVGSVGEPRNPDDIRARYVIYDEDTRSVGFRRVEFDVEAYRAELRASGLSVTPYFLRVVDHYQEALAQSQVAGAAHAMMVDMQTQAVRPVMVSSARRQLVVPSARVDVGGPKPRVRGPVVKQRSPVVALTVVGVFLAVVVAGLIWLAQSSRDQGSLVAEAPGGFSGGEQGSDGEAEVARSVTGVAAEAGAGSSLPLPGDGVAGRWRFDEVGDTAGEPAMLAIEVGEMSAPLVDPIPWTGEANTGAVIAGAWREREVSDWFVLSAERSFTFECWYSAAPAEGAIEFLAGTRSDASDGARGWQLICSSADPGSFLFSYDPGGRGGSVDLSFSGEGGFDGNPHHLALVWDHEGGGAEGGGAVRFYLDGEECGAARIPIELIPPGPVGKLFCLGGRPVDGESLFQGTLDEARFSLGVLGPEAFLSAVGEGVELPDDPVAAEPAVTVAMDEPSVDEGDAAAMLEAADVVAYWKMDDEAGAAAIADRTGRFPLEPLQAWTPSEPIAPNPVPATLEANARAAQVRFLGEAPGSVGSFALTKEAGFTFEGWFHTGGQERVTLGSTLTGDEPGGWRVALLRAEGATGFAAFMYENGERKVQALGRDLSVFDDRPHHFAAVWDPGTAAGSGRLSVFIDREEVGNAVLAHADIAEGTSNPFQIGSGQGEITVDELRFSSRARTPKEFLSTGDTILFDLEGDAFDGWAVEGSAFGTKPAGVGLTATKAVSNHRGQRIAHSSHGGDGATGKIVSAPFRITHRYLRFLVGGGTYDDATYVGLEIDGKLVHRATGHENLDLFEELWDLSGFANSEARFVAVDSHRGRWGVIAFDHVVLTDEDGGLTPLPPLE